MDIRTGSVGCGMLPRFREPSSAGDSRRDPFGQAVTAATPPAEIGPGPFEESDMPARVAVKLTMRSVDALSTGERDAMFWDRDLPGFVMYDFIPLI